MAETKLDLKNPGGKEILVIGGGALLLALIYFAFSKKAPAGAAPSPGSGTGPGGAPGGNVPAYLLPADTSGGVASATGNVFTDAGMATAGIGGTGSSGPTMPPFTLRSPSLSATGQNALNAGSSSSPFVGAGGPAPAGQSGGGYVTYAQIFQALRAKGLSAIEATGILGNIQNESGGQVENTSGDAGMSIGLIQWHNKDKYLVTGNVAHDFPNQINAIVQWFKSAGVSGSTPQAVASSFASNIEGCVGCQPGGSQNTQRQANAAAFYQQYQKGAFNPPKKTAAATTTAGSKNFPGGLKAWSSGGWQANYHKLFGAWPPGYKPPKQAVKKTAPPKKKPQAHAPPLRFPSRYGILGRGR